MIGSPQKHTATPLQNFELYRPVLTRFFRRRAHSADVDDLVQDVLLSLHARTSGGPIENVERYLFTVASRAWSLHSQRSRRLGWRSEDDAGDLNPEEISAERILIARQDLSRVAELIARGLPPRTQEVFMLHRFEEMTYPAIAAALKISVSAVEQHISKALKILALGLREST
jgi:RNA polymerase sigma factor (sigma-70 family)